MIKGGPNIDIVFRNGLKDIEVLPPTEVWDGLQTYIVTKHRTFILLKVAAVLAIVLSAAIYIYHYTQELSPEFSNAIVALNVANPPSIKKTLQDVPEAFPEIKSNFKAETVPFKYEIRKKEVSLKKTESNPVPQLSFLSSTNLVPKGKTKPVTLSYPELLNNTREENFQVDQPESLSLDDLNNSKPVQRWSVAAMASPTYYSRFNSDNSDISKQLKESEQPVVSYTGGVALSFKLGKRLSVQSGLYYSSLSKEVEGINSYGGFQKYDYAKGDHNFEVLTTNGPVYTTNEDIFLASSGPGNRVVTPFNNDVFDPQKVNLQYLNNTLQQNLSYLEFPVLLRYKIIDKTLGMNMLGGISYNMLVGNSVFTMVDGNKYAIGKTIGVNPFTLSSSIGMGMEYSFSSKLSINLEPTLRYYLNPFSKIGSTGSHPYSIGIFSGLSYKF